MSMPPSSEAGNASSAQCAQARTAAQTIEEILAGRPVLAPVLRAFEPLLTAQSELVAEWIADSALERASAEDMRAGGGTSPASLLPAAVDLRGSAARLRRSAARLLPLLANVQALQPHIPDLGVFFLQPAEADPDGPDDLERLAAAVVAGDGETSAGIAEDNGLDPLILDFVAGFVVSPVLRAMAAQVTSQATLQATFDMPRNIRQQGRCPMCGALPIIAFLERPAVDEKNTFLAGGGGKKHLHCGLCGTDWVFRRSACPACGEEGSGVIEIVRESGPSHGERLDWCTKCGTYCPTVDLRECGYTPNLDAAALGMMHLDMVAARKQLRPLKPSFWNMF